MLARGPTQAGVGQPSPVPETTGNQVSAWGPLPALQGSTVSSGFLILSELRVLEATRTFGMQPFAQKSWIGL